MEDIKLIEKNTKLLRALYKYPMPTSEKVGMLNQIYQNLKFLKTEMPKDSFQKKYGEFDKRVTSIVGKITDSKFLTELIEKVEGFIKQYSK